MDPNCKLFYATLEVPSSEVKRSEQVKVSGKIGLGWIEKSKENQSTAE